jgi:uracil-DNA glycosylase
MSALTVKESSVNPSLSSSSKRTSTSSWGSLRFWKQSAWRTLKSQLKRDFAAGICTPYPHEILRPLALTRLKDVRVVFVFPEAYYSGAATGVPIGYRGDRKPYLFAAFEKELQEDVGVKVSKPDFTKWCKQGVLLWNSRPATRVDQIGGYVAQGFRDLTQEIIETVYLQNPRAVFVFFGNHDHIRATLPEDALVYQLPVPVPSPHCGFRGSRIFTQINIMLRSTGQRRIDWSI